MPTLNRAFLERIAKAYVGEPVAVVADYLPTVNGRDVWGTADYDGSRYVVTLSSDMVHKIPGAIAETFFHEVAHIMAGHVPKTKIQRSGYGVEALNNRRSTGQKNLSLRKKIAKHEFDADAWAEAELSAFWQKYGDPLRYMLS